VRTSPDLSGATVHGVAFSALTTGPDPSNSGGTSISGVYFSFSGNTGETVYTFADSTLDLGASTIPVFTDTTSAGTFSNFTFTADSTTIIDGNSVNLTYSGVSYELLFYNSYSGVGPTFTGSGHTINTELLSAGTLDFTGRTIWTDVQGILRTEKMIITDNPVVGYIWTCTDSEGMGGWQPSSGATSGESNIFTAQTGMNSVAVLSGSNTTFPTSVQYSVAEGYGNSISADYTHISGLNNFLGSGATRSAIIGGQNLSGYSADTVYVPKLNIINYSSFSGLDSYETALNVALSSSTPYVSAWTTSYHQYLDGATLYNRNDTNNGGVAIRYITTDGTVNNYFATGAINGLCLGEGLFDFAFQNEYASTVDVRETFRIKHTGTINIPVTPSATTTEAELLVRDSSGNILTRNVSSLSGSVSYWSADTVGTDSIVPLNSGSIASGTKAIAEGFQTTAGGDYSHAEGTLTTASGTGSHAEGGSTSAYGDYSHSEGLQTTASGQASHSEGYLTSAMTFHAHTEGSATYAGGTNAHAEGNSTSAIGFHSHSEGESTTTDGYASHAEGYFTHTTGYSSHAEGYRSTAYGAGSHAEGGDVVGTKSGGKSLGIGSHAEGVGTTAFGYASHVEGASGEAWGTYSHVEGQAAEASGSASHAEGRGTKAHGDYSHTGGYSTVVTGITSFNHSYASSPTIGIYGVYADYSAILGGVNGYIDAAATGSTILGGTGISGVSADTVYVPDLVIDGLINVTDLQTDANGRIIDGASDIQFKTNIQTIPSSIDLIRQLNPVSFEWKPEMNLRNGTVYGLIAQEVQNVIPNIVRERAKGGGLTLEYKELIPWIIKAIQELLSGGTQVFDTERILAEDNNIELNFNGTHDTAIGGGITVIKGVNDTTDSTFTIDENGNFLVSPAIIPEKIILPESTPTSSNDSTGSIGELRWDDNYMYMKTNNGWRRANLETF
jgi:hypothetical protein